MIAAYHARSPASARVANASISPPRIVKSATARAMDAQSSRRRGASVGEALLALILTAVISLAKVRSPRIPAAELATSYAACSKV